MPQATLEVVLDHIHAIRRRNLEDIATRLHPEIVHQGILPQLICEGSDQVLDNMRGTLQETEFGVDRLEILDAGERVVVGLAGPRFRAREGVPLQGQVFLVFTVREGKIIRMDDFLTREEALKSARVDPPQWGVDVGEKERVTPILRVEDADRAVAWYKRLGFTKVSEHRFGPGMPAFVTVTRGDIQLFLSEHTGDARPGTLIYLSVTDVDSVAEEFGLTVEEEPWGREVETRDPDGNRLRIGSPLR